MKNRIPLLPQVLIRRQRNQYPAYSTRHFCDPYFKRIDGDFKGADIYMCPVLTCLKIRIVLKQRLRGISDDITWKFLMRIPAKYGNFLFGGLLSAIMVTIVSGAVVLLNQGLTHDLPAQWLKSFATAWPIAFATVLVVAPRVRKLVARLIEPAKVGESV